MKHSKTNKNKKDALKEKLTLLRRVSMSEEEKDRMGTFLSRYVELHPVLGEQERAIKERKERYSAFNALIRRFTPAFAMLVFFVWGGIALAGTALPGGALYGVKTTSEDFRESFSFNTEWKARFEAELINRRLNEAHQLLEQGGVSERSIEELVRELEENLEDLDALLETLEAEDEHLLAFEIEKAFRSSINMYKDVFVSMSETNKHVEAFLIHVALQFGLPNNYFAMDTQGNSLALERRRGDEGEVNTMSLLAEEDGADTAQTEELQGVSGDTLRAHESSDMQMMAVDSNEKSESEMLGVGSAFDLETLSSYVSVRISETEREIEGARRLDERLRDALLLRFEKAQRLYEEAALAEEFQDESIAHSLFLESLSIVEDLRSLLQMGVHKPSELSISSILKKLENEGAKEDPSSFLELEEEVRGIRKGADEPGRFNEEQGEERSEGSNEKP